MPLLSSLSQASLARPARLGFLAAIIACAHSCSKENNLTSDSDASSQINGTQDATQEEPAGKAESSFLSLSSDAPINWQPWNKDVFKLAKEQRKTVFAFVGSGSDVNTLKYLDDIYASPATCELINNNHVNVLIDSNCDAAMEFLATGLCLKTGSLVSRPNLIWFSYEGYPVSWNAGIQNVQGDNSETLSRMSTTVSKLWQEDPQYILRDSRENYSRKGLDTMIIPSEEHDPTYPIRAIRHISSFYDPTSNSIDNIDQISPARYANLLTKASVSSAIPDSQKQRYIDIAKRSVNNTIIYGLIDPVDQGIFDNSQFKSTALPRFSKSLKTQALSMEALYNLYQVTGEKIFLTTANNIKTYVEKNLKVENGDYLVSIVYARNKDAENRCTWTLEELQSALTKEELELCKLAFGVRKEGNVPLLDDWNRVHFNKNTLTWKTTREQLAESANIDITKMESLLGSAMKKISDLRSQRGSNAHVEKVVSVKSLALYSKSLVAGYRATGNKIHLQDAQRVFARIKDGFFDEDGKLRETKFENKLSTLPPSGSAFALVCETALDLHETTLEKSYLDIAQALHNELNSTLKDKDNQYLYEQDFSKYPADYKIKQPVTIPAINNFSTWALAWSNSARLLGYHQDEQLKKQQQALGEYFQSLSDSPPIITIDYLTRYSELEVPHVYINGKLSDDLLLIAIKRPCRIIIMNESSHHDLDQDVPAGSAAVKKGDKLIGITNQASELNQWLK